MIRTLTRAFRLRPKSQGARRLVFAVLGVLAIGFGAEAVHAHESDLESAQCVVCHWHDQRVESPTTPAPDIAPPIRIVEVDEEAPPRTRTAVRSHPPATGPPAVH